MSPSCKALVFGLAVIAVIMASLITFGGRGFPWHPIKEVTISGIASCTSGSPVVGVYIAEITNVGDFATWDPVAQHPSVATYHLDIPVGVAYEVHVGCGGTPDRWAVDAKSANSDALARNVVCEDRVGLPRYGTCD